MGKKVDSSASPSFSRDAGSVAPHRFPTWHPFRASPTGNTFITSLSNSISTWSIGMRGTFLSNHSAKSSLMPSSL